MMTVLVFTAFIATVIVVNYRSAYRRGVLDTESRWREAVGRSCSPDCRRYPHAGEQ
jgi:hypothetical protein